MEKKQGRPKRLDKDNATVPSAEKGTKPGDIRKTYIVTSDLVDKIDGIAYNDRITVKEVVNEALTSHVNKWEKKNGAVLLPKKK